MGVLVPADDDDGQSGMGLEPGFVAVIGLIVYSFLSKGTLHESVVDHGDSKTPLQRALVRGWLRCSPLIYYYRANANEQYCEHLYPGRIPPGLALNRASICVSH